MVAFVRTIARAWVLSWLFLLWSALCVSAGAAAMWVAIAAAVEGMTGVRLH